MSRLLLSRLTFRLGRLANNIFPQQPQQKLQQKLPELLRLSDSVWLQVFTHRSYFARPTHVFEDPPDDPAPDNENLEHLGDSVVSLVVTQLILETWPGLRVGPATKIRSRVVGNNTLAEISLRYDLPRWLRLHPSQENALKDSQKVQADLFEAYVGGLYLDHGLPLAKWWLSEVMKPRIVEAYQEIREEHGLARKAEEAAEILEREKQENHERKRTLAEKLLIPPNIQTSLVGYLSLFNQHCQQKNLEVDWKYCDVPGGTKATPVWSVDAIINGNIVGTGQGHTKKAARNDAAKLALKFLGITVP